MEPAPRIEPVVRIRCASPADEARCRRVLAAAGLEAESSLTWLVVRDADPDRVNRTLVAGGALGRTAIREAIGKLLGWLIDRQGALDGRARNVKALVERVLADGGLAARYAPRADDELLAEAARLYREIMAQGAPFIPWAAFVERFCRLRAIAS
ncbi:MAG TPA: hypothetical protein VFP65_21730 [Anaeromyxobacteraceae bacterium]|nr:hypothetical protein [Anaeromyxobacteraceae bacterium]